MCVYVSVQLHVYHTYIHTHSHEEDNGKFKHRLDAKKLAVDLGFVSTDVVSADTAALDLDLDTPAIVI